MLSKVQLYAKQNLLDASRKSKWLDDNIEHYHNYDYWNDDGIDDEWFKLKFECFNRIINALETLKPKEDHKEDLNHYMPGWEYFAVPA